MKRLIIGLFLFGALAAQAQVPEPVITVGEVWGRLAVVAGRLSSKPQRPVGISVLNGNIISSTLTDDEGRWSIVIRHLSQTVSVSAWDLTDPSEKSLEVKSRLVLK